MSNPTLALWLKISENAHVINGLNVAHSGPSLQFIWSFHVEREGFAPEPINDQSSVVRHRSSALLIVDAVEAATDWRFVREITWRAVWIGDQFTTKTWVHARPHPPEHLALLGVIDQVLAEIANPSVPAEDDFSTIVDHPEIDAMIGEMVKEQ